MGHMSGQLHSSGRSVPSNFAFYTNVLGIITAATTV